MSDVTQPCRICLMEGTQLNGVYQRCNCGFFHDDCFKEWLRRRTNDTCEICSEQFRGIRRHEREIVVANLRRQAIVWLIVYTMIIVMCLVLQGLMETYSNCVYNARKAKEPINRCNGAGWNDVENLLTVIVAFGTTALSLHAFTVCACPREAGIVVTSRRLDIVIVPGCNMSENVDHVIHI